MRSPIRLFKRFSRIRAGKTNSAPPAEWWVKVNNRIELGLRKVSDGLARRTQYWSRGSWIVALALFILLFGGCSLWLILKAML